MKKITEFEKKIEKQRTKLKNTIKKEGIDDRKVLKESEKLDKLLEKYYKYHKS